MDLTVRIADLKRRRRTVVAAHTYQPPEVQALADIVGDSFVMAQQAAASAADTVVVAGVRFMAEGIKLLAPEKTVVLAAPDADCPMAWQIKPEQVMEYKKAHPTAAVAVYINSSARLKAVSDVCVTSSSAVRIISRLPQEEILFIPDRNLGAYVAAALPGKKIATLEGYCPIHAKITADDINAAKKRHPGAAVAIHPECPPEALACADFTGSTAAIIEFVQATENGVIVVTERGVTDALSPRYPGRLHQLCPDKLTCPDMKLTTPAMIWSAMQRSGGLVIEIEPELAQAARQPLLRMMELHS